MKIIVAKTAGFCMGVRRAVEMVLDADKKNGGPIFTYGPLIHNPQVLKILKEKGVRVLYEIPERGSGTVLIRAHGVPPEIGKRLENAGFRVIDATCPRVIKVQTIIKKHAAKGYASIIVGDHDHPEVVGLKGYAEGKGAVVGKMEQLETLPVFEKAIIVAQTTQNTRFYEDVKSWFGKNRPHYLIFDTICDSTGKRQDEVARLSRKVDAVVVVGGYSSGNTQRLFEIAKKSGKPAFHVESESELDLSGLAGCKSVGLTAGASTPNWALRGVYRTLETIPLKFGRQFSKTVLAVQTLLLFSNVYLALGAGFLSFGCTKLQGIDGFFPHGLVAFFYVQSMHIFNNLTGRRADRYNNPEKALFYDRNRHLLLILACVSGLAGMITAYVSGSAVFSLFLLMSVTGALYNVRLVPADFLKTKTARLKDIPASKTFLIALAWGIATSFFAPLSVFGKITVPSVLVFVWSAGLVFVRTAFFDILDMHGDRMVGRETLPIVFGEKWTSFVLKTVAGFLCLLVFFASLFNVFTALGYFLTACPLLLFVIVVLYEKGRLMPSLRLELLVETNFLLAGMIAIAVVGLF